MPEAARWLPLLTGDLADQAWASLREVASALRDRTLAEGDAGREAARVGLARDPAGPALFLMYLGGATGDSTYTDDALSHLHQALDTLATSACGPGFYDGFTGVAWTVEHLEGRFLGRPAEDEATNADVDGALVDVLRAGPWAGDYDLVAGLAGFAVYGLEALPRPAGREILELVVTRLEEAARETDHGRAWFTPLERLPPHERQEAPHGYYNLGVAHGVPGAISVAAATAAAAIVPERARALAEDASRWLLGQEYSSDSLCRFPNWVAEGGEPHLSRLAWCYGDVGLSVCLLGAARRLGREDLEAEARSTARRAAGRPPERAGVVDAGLCHGAAGVGHLFNRLFQATGEEPFAEAARFWFRRVLELRRPGLGIGQYPAWEPSQGGWKRDRGFLGGAAGVAIALLAAVTDLEPEWDRALLAAVGRP